jgi:hypothetical protein
MGKAEEIVFQPDAFTIRTNNKKQTFNSKHLIGLGLLKGLRNAGGF